MRSILVLGAASALCAATYAGPAVPVEVIAQEGTAPAGAGGATVGAVNSPYTNANGIVGFLVSLSDGARAIWYDDDVIFVSTSALPDTLSGGEASIGISDDAGFNYSPSFNGDDAVWTQNGLLQVENVAAPGFDPPTTNTFNSRPRMIANGRAYWISGYDPSGGSSSVGRVLYTSSDATAVNTAIVLRAGDMIDGLELDDGSGIDFDYDFSDDGAHHIHVLNMVTGSTLDDTHLYVDGSLVLRETFPTGDGDNWDNFDFVGINTSGRYVFSGDTDGDAASDEFVGVDGSIAVREGDTLDGTLVPAFVRSVSINNIGTVAHIWGQGSGASAIEHLFVGKSNDLSVSRRLLSLGDLVDVDDDGTGDATVDDFNAFIGGLDLADERFVYVEVDLIDVGETDSYEAILKLEMFCGGDLDQDLDVDLSDLLDLLAAWGNCPDTCPNICAGDIAGDNCIVNTADLLALLAEWGACAP